MDVLSKADCGGTKALDVPSLNDDSAFREAPDDLTGFDLGCALEILSQASSSDATDQSPCVSLTAEREKQYHHDERARVGFFGWLIGKRSTSRKSRAA